MQIWGQVGCWHLYIHAHKHTRARIEKWECLTVKQLISNRISNTSWWRSDVRVCGRWGRVLSRKQWIPRPFHFSALSCSVTHTNSLCLSQSFSQGIPRKWLRWWLSVWTFENVYMLSACLLYPPTSFLLCPAKFSQWIIQQERGRDVVEIREGKKKNSSIWGCQRGSIIKHS